MTQSDIERILGRSPVHWVNMHDMCKLEGVCMSSIRYRLAVGHLPPPDDFRVGIGRRWLVATYIRHIAIEVAANQDR